MKYIKMHLFIVQTIPKRKLFYWNFTKIYNCRSNCLQTILIVVSNYYDNSF